MSEHGIGFFAGALVAVFLVSRLLLWLMRTWEGGGLARLSIANCFSWILASFFGGMGMGLRAATIYIVPQSVVMIFDVSVYLWRQRNQPPATPLPITPSPTRAPLPITPRPTRAPLPIAPRPITRGPPPAGSSFALRGTTLSALLRGLWLDARKRLHNHD